MGLKFRKMHGCGNDFVILDFRSESEDLSNARIMQICDRHIGVGCDQHVIIEPSEKANVKVIFYNSDGSTSGACGNASRCVADIIMRENNLEECSLETGAGILRAWRVDEETIKVDMGQPRLGWQDIPLSEERDTLMLMLDEKAKNPAVAVNMGNPHCVLFVEDAEDALVERIGPKVENHPLFPQRTNVEFVQQLEGNRLRQRTWERGAGETLACGSGACAVAVAAISRDLIDGREVEIILNGGKLSIEWSEADSHVYMTGPIEYVFEGQLSLT